MSGEVSLKEFQEMKTMLHQSGELILKSVGNSMYPVLPREGSLNIAPVLDLTELKKFDLIVYLDQGMLYCHYLWHINRFAESKDETLIQLKAINPAYKMDHPVPYRQLLGKLNNVKLNRWQKFIILMRSLMK